MLSRSFERKIRFFYLQLWPWRQFVYAVFASRDIARRTRASAAEGKGRDYAESAEECFERLWWLLHGVPQLEIFWIFKFGNFLNFLNWKFSKFSKLEIFWIFKFGNFLNFLNWKFSKFSKLEFFFIFRIGNFGIFQIDNWNCLNWKTNKFIDFLIWKIEIWLKKLAILELFVQILGTGLKGLIWFISFFDFFSRSTQILIESNFSNSGYLDFF